MRPVYSNELMHYGIMGMKWGVRRYQNPDGTLTEAGRKRYDRQQKWLDAYKKSETAGFEKYQTKKINRLNSKLAAQRAKTDFSNSIDDERHDGTHYVGDAKQRLKDMKKEQSIMTELLYQKDLLETGKQKIQELSFDDAKNEVKKSIWRQAGMSALAGPGAALGYGIAERWYGRANRRMNDDERNQIRRYSEAEAKRATTERIDSVRKMTKSDYQKYAKDQYNIDKISNRINRNMTIAAERKKKNPDNNKFDPRDESIRLINYMDYLDEHPSSEITFDRFKKWYYVDS